QGAVLAPVGALPFDPAEPVAVGRTERHQELLAQSSELALEQLAGSMRVYVEVPDRSFGATIMNRLRPWLHVLLALSANSPIWRGRDTGFASWRSISARRRAADGPPPYVRNAAEYDRFVDQLVALGVVPDRGQVDWWLRLSDPPGSSRPTVEIQVCDVQLDVQSAVMITGLARALVCRALRDAVIGVSEPRFPSALGRAAGWQAARHGVSDELIQLSAAAAGKTWLRPALDVVAALLAHVAPVADDLDALMPALADTLLGAGGAERQRRALAEGGQARLLDLVRLANEPAGVEAA
ncbi:MAG TPA: glutamate-cysteine ligase family protein, partial [Kineosporiaceae bacterium]